MKVHAIIIDKSIPDPNLWNKLKVIGKRESPANFWTLFKIDFSKVDENLIKNLQENLIGNFYFHYYNANEIKVIFKEKIFTLTKDKITWKEMQEYGLSIGVPKDQLTIQPISFEDETF
ncbi:MAG: hypothetical protein WC915_02590 [archaeon]